MHRGMSTVCMEGKELIWLYGIPCLSGWSVLGLTKMLALKVRVNESYPETDR